MHGLRLYLWWCANTWVSFSESSYEDYTEHLSVGLRRYNPQNLLSSILGRRVWWCGVFILLLTLFMQESWCLPWFDQWYAISKCTLVLCWLLWVAGGDVLAWAWSSAPGTCSAPPQVTCPAPPWCLAPPPCLPCTSLVLGLLLAAPGLV
jgi:hypothetical protein